MLTWGCLWVFNIVETQYIVSPVKSLGKNEVKKHKVLCLYETKP